MMAEDAQKDPLVVWELLLRTVTGLMRTFDEEMKAGINLDLTWFDVLIQLYEAPEEKLRMQLLAELVVLSRSGLTRLVDRLEEAGLVRREHSTEDRRGAYAVLTDAGRKVCIRARAFHHQSILEHFTRHVTQADLAGLSSALTKVRDGGIAIDEGPR